MVGLASFVTVVSLAAVQVSAWGPLGHATVASVALEYLLPETLHAVNKILANDPAPFVPQTSTATVASATSSVSSLLSSTSSSAALVPRSTGKPVTLTDIASWADDYRYTPEGAFSAGLHYVDAEDAPPKTCSVDIKRDCPPEGCILSAIANYTSRLQDHRLDATQRAQALKWVTHFLGDIQQPLHDEAEALGGNTINILWNGTVVNLHHIWDTEMPTKLAGEFTPENVQKWTKKIVKELSLGGKYWIHKWDWVSCDDIHNAEECATVWAREANAYVCSFVLHTDPSGKEMSTDYYKGAAPIIDMQIAKGGVRLAAWLNTIFAGWNGFY